MKTLKTTFDEVLFVFCKFYSLIRCTHRKTFPCFIHLEILHTLDHAALLQSLLPCQVTDFDQVTHLAHTADQRHQMIHALLCVGLKSKTISHGFTVTDLHVHAAAQPSGKTVGRQPLHSVALFYRNGS